MSCSISPKMRQEWITAYKEAYGQLSKAQAVLTAVVVLLKGDGINDDLTMDPSAREGLYLLLNNLSADMAVAFYDNLPDPKLFAELCNGNGGQGDD